MKNFSISDIENLTGIKAHTIRAWEHRYKFLQTKRTSTNIRYYDDQDLSLLLNIATLNDNGFKISHIVKMTRNEINQQVKRLKADNGNIHIQVQMLINGMLKLDEDEFNDNLKACIKELGLIRTMHEIIFPFLNKAGEMWQVGTINATHEHFATHLVKQRIIAATSKLHKSETQQGKKYLLFLPPGELHETGLLFANYLLKSHGNQVLYIGASTPYSDLTEVVKYYKPDFSLSVLTTASVHTDVGITINKILQHIPEGKILLAGPLLINQSPPKKSRLIFIKSIPEFVQMLNPGVISLAS